MLEYTASTAFAQRDKSRQIAENAQKQHPGAGSILIDRSSGQAVITARYRDQRRRRYDELAKQKNDFRSGRSERQADRNRRYETLAAEMGPAPHVTRPSGDRKARFDALAAEMGR